MARIPRKLAGIGATDLANAAAFDAYVGPAREMTVDHVRGILALHDGATAGGKQYKLTSLLPNGGTTGQVPARASGGGVEWVSQSGGSISPATLRGYLSGLTLSNSISAPNTQIDVAAGVANADDASQLMQASSNGAIDCATVGANGLDAGALANNTWYHAFLIGKTDGTVARLASTSAAAPTMPSGYTKKRRIGSFKTNASAQIVKFVQRGFDFLWDVPVSDYVGNNPGTAAILTPLSVPTGVVVKAEFYYYLQASDSARRVALITSPSQAATAPVAGTASTIATGVGTTPGLTQARIQTWTNTSGQIRHQLDSSGATTAVFIVTNGWHDPL